MLGHALVGEPRFCAALATAAARWQPQSSLWVAWRGEEGYSAWGVGPEAAEVPREAAGEAGGGLRPSTAAAAVSSDGGREKQRSREVGDEVWTDLQFSKSLGALL